MSNEVQSGENTRNIIIHNHLFKNAGSTIDWALEKNFGFEFVDHRDNESMKDQNSYLSHYFAKNQSVKVFSTHHLRLPLPEIKSVRFITLMMFRHPIERVLSVYRFEKNQKYSDTLGAVNARNKSMREYIQWRLDPGVPPSIRNFHVGRCLPRRNYNRFPVTSVDVCEVKRIVDQNLLFGIVDMFDESMVIMERSLKQFFPNIDLSYVRQNVNPNNIKGFKHKLSELEDNLGTEVMQFLNDHNKEDMEIYEYTRALLLDRISATENFSLLLNDFQRRCRMKAA